ncbi:MAG: type VI secretion system protein TssR domain-containing protein, partial [Polaribacter sp.]
MLYKKYFTLLFCCCYQLAFGQIGNYTKVKKICKNTYNFLENANFRSRQHADKGLYVVYSDRDENNSYLDALGLKQGQQQKFLTPYFVVGENTDFLELVKFNPDIIGKPQGFFSFLYGSTYNFTDKKSVEYVGWIQKDKLLHFSKSKVNEANLKPLVYYLGVNDTKTLFNLREYIKKDSVYTFNDPNLKIKAKKLFNINQLVYLYKYNTSKKAALVSNFKEIQASDSLERVMGWVPSSLVKKIGQRKVIKIKEDQDVFFTNYDSTYTIKPRDIHSSLLFMPAKKYKKKKSIVDSISPVSHVPLNLWDHYNNKLINVKGGDILLRELPVIKKQNKTFNLHFVFDCSPDLREKLVLQITSLQNIWLLISEDERYKEYDFTFSASSFGCSKYYHFPKSDSFALWLDYLQKIFLNDTTLASKESNAVGIEK